jgi:hypothetical protein
MSEAPKVGSKPPSAGDKLFKKEAAATEGAKAMAEYQAGVEARNKKTVRLREMRIAREAVELEAKIKADRKAEAAAKRAAARAGNRAKKK